MMALVDTSIWSIWSLALRRKPEHLSALERRLTEALAELIRVQLVGPVRQELLSGIREEAQFRRLRDYLRAFPEQALEAEDYETAAQMNNRCRNRGRRRIGRRLPDLCRCPAARVEHFHHRSWFPELCGHTAVAAPRGVPHSLV